MKTAIRPRRTDFRKAAGPIKRRKTACSACGGQKLASVLELKKFPLTGIYVKERRPGAFAPVDQGLSLCRACGHAQLDNILYPGYLYDQTYTHRSSQSPIATGGNDFFHAFVASLIGDRTYRRIVDVGCNDLVLLRKLEPLGEKLLGVDPIWRGNEPAPEGKIRVIGKFIEEVDLAQELGGKPDLVVSTHTFEHIDEPKAEIQRLMAAAAPDALFVFEVPSFDTLMAISRFDQVFHQHLQYFSLASFQKMVEDLGCRVVAHSFNYYYWGGTMLVAFRRKASAAGEKKRFTVHSEKAVSESLARFRGQLRELNSAIDSLDDTPLYGYGAAQMLPTLAYHMGTDLSGLKAVLDDDPRREGLLYPGLAPRIEKPAAEFSLEGAAALITALDSVRPILRRVISLRPKRILLPLNIF